MTLAENNTNESSGAKSIRSGIIDFIAGSLGGVAVVYVGQPLDTVKVKMQTFPSLYKGMVECFVRTLQTDGVRRGLYAGTVPAVVANVAENSVLFAAYGGCQKAISSVLGVEKIQELSSFQNASAGFFAAFFSSLTLCPTELIKCKLQAMREVQNGIAASKDVTWNGKSSPSGNHAPPSLTAFKPLTTGPWRLTRQIVGEEGIKGLFRGLSSTMAREMPGYFFFFGGYELSRELLRAPGQSKEDIGWQKTMLAGAVAGAILWTIIFPADVIKSRIQVQNLKEPALNIFKEVAKKEGIGALYNGLAPTLIRTVPATAALFLTYEYSKKLMHSFFEPSQQNKFSL